MRNHSAGIVRPGIICAAIALSTLSCKQTGVGPDGGGTAGFLFKLTVLNSAGQPAGGLQISVSNSMSPLPVSIRPVGTKASAAGPDQSGAPLGINAVTMLRFDMPTRARITLAVFDMDGSQVSLLINKSWQAPGAYAVQFPVSHLYGTRVYKCRLIATDSAGSTIVFRDSTYAVLWNADLTLGVIGSTSSAGTFQTQDSLLFPNILTLPPLVQTNSFGPVPVGVFYIPDTVNVLLSDTVARVSQSFACAVHRGTNDIHIVWNPISAGRAASAGPAWRGLFSAAGSAGPPDSLVVTWKLYQNYPNPFN